MKRAKPNSRSYSRLMAATVRLIFRPGQAIPRVGRLLFRDEGNERLSEIETPFGPGPSCPVLLLQDIPKSLWPMPIMER